MINRRILAALMAAVLCLTCLTGCQQQGGESSETQETETGFTPSLDKDTTQTITVIGNYDNLEALEAAGAEFQKYYPNITVAYEKLDDYNTNMTPRLQEDSEVALFMISRYHFINNEALGDLITDVSEIGIDFDQINPSAYESVYYNGKMYGIPIWFQYYGMVVNEDLFKAEGLEIPTNLSELYECCEKLVTDGYVPLQQSSWMLRTFFLPWILRTAAKEMTNEELQAALAGEEGSCDKLASVFETILDMIDKGYISRESMASYEDYYNAAILNFFEGDVPMMVATSETVTGMAKRETRSEAFQANPFGYHFVYSPIGETEPIVYKSMGVSFGLSSNCSYQEVAQEFYRFLYTEDILNMMADIKGAPSTAKNPSTELYGNLQEVSGNDLVVAGEFNDPTDKLQDVFGDTCDLISSGEVNSVEDALRMMEELARQ